LAPAIRCGILKRLYFTGNSLVACPLKEPSMSSSEPSNIDQYQGRHRGWEGDKNSSAERRSQSLHGLTVPFRELARLATRLSLVFIVLRLATPLADS
jgi:hypothetical protein